MLFKPPTAAVHADGSYRRPAFFWQKTRGYSYSRAWFDGAHVVFFSSDFIRIAFRLADDDVRLFGRVCLRITTRCEGYTKEKQTNNAEMSEFRIFVLSLMIIDTEILRFGCANMAKLNLIGSLSDFYPYSTTLWVRNSFFCIIKHQRSFCMQIMGSDPIRI